MRGWRPCSHSRHPLARSTRRPCEPNQFFGRRGPHTAPPCWRPSCTQRDTCNGGRECPVFQASTKSYGSDTKDFLRAMLAEGPFAPHAELLCQLECPGQKLRLRRSGSPSTGVCCVLDCVPHRTCTNKGGTKGGTKSRASGGRHWSDSSPYPLWDGSSAEASQDLRATAHVWPGVGGRPTDFASLRTGFRV